MKENIEALQLFRVHARNFSNKIYTYEANSINSHGKLYQGILTKSAFTISNISLKKQAVSKEPLLKMAEEITKNILEALSLYGNPPVLSIILQFAHEKKPCSNLWLLGVIKLAFTKPKIKGIQKILQRSKSQKRTDKLLMLIPRDPMQTIKAHDITVETRKLLEKSEIKKLNMRKSPSFENANRTFKNMIRIPDLLKTSRNKSYENLHKVKTFLSKKFETPRVDRSDTVSPLLGIVKMKLDPNIKKNDIIYTINKRTIKNYKNNEQVPIEKTLRFCRGDFCNNTKRASYQISGLLILLGKPPIFCISHKNSFNDNSITIKNPIIKIPQVGTCDNLQMNETHSNGNFRQKEKNNELKMISEQIIQKANSIKSDQLLSDPNLTKILDIIRKHNTLKMTEVCENCKKVYEKVAFYILKILNGNSL